MKKACTILLMAGAMFLTGCGSSSAPGEQEIENFYDVQNEEVSSVEYAEHNGGYMIRVNESDYFFVSKDGNRFSEVDPDNHALVGMGFTEEVPEQ